MKQLTDKDIELICSVLDGWTDKLTWEALIDVVKVRLGRTFTRQALDRHTRIKHAYKLRKNSFRSLKGTPEGKPVELQKALERIDRLQGENQRLKSENQALLEQFVRWAHNAYTKGLTQEQLNRPLPPVDRARTMM